MPIYGNAVYRQFAKDQYTPGDQSLLIRFHLAKVSGGQDVQAADKRYSGRQRYAIFAGLQVGLPLPMLVPTQQFSLARTKLDRIPYAHEEIGIQLDCDRRFALHSRYNLAAGAEGNPTAMGSASGGFLSGWPTELVDDVAQCGT